MTVYAKEVDGMRRLTKQSGAPAIYLKKRAPLLMMMLVLFVIGVIIGTVLQNSVDEQVKSRLSEILIRHAAGSSVGFSEAFFDSLFSALQLILLCLVLSLSYIGVLAGPAVSLITGFSFGFTLSLVMFEYGSRGFVYNILAFSPRLLFLIPVLLLLCSESLAFGRKTLSLLSGNQKISGSVWLDLAFLLFLTVLAAAAAVLAACLEAALLPIASLNITGS